ncbi:hypothetical protein SAMN05444280_11277 [Tangfeifania diversioriginum]|uniref:DUF5681 domain-containing protein n=1 Tax=Tangfeifania diversioriginum TaxID=1168035 RepID=A0A1M6H466_9BACT|nr:hypothetical protein [Tangfeifania diversioriginum]SHJ16980.1 hypothetical protein SAMN05444280_11277 [Tangfeifania diversioriginum]
MGLKKGMTNNPKGRPKGTRNLTTTEAKGILNGILKQNFTPAKVNRDLKELEPRQRLDMLTKLLSFTLPRPTEGTLDLNFQNLTDEQLNYILENLLQKSQQNDED